MLNKLFVITSSLIAGAFADNIAIADFSEKYSQNLLKGSIKIDMGIVKFDGLSFNLANEDTLNKMLPVPYSECIDGGMLYHLHVGACAPDNVKFGTDCNACLGHYDPLGVCGDASNNTLCKRNGGCLPDSTIGCNLQNFLRNPYTACQVGDWSGKYGYATVSSTGQINQPNGAQSFYEVVPGDVMGKSVVFHCNNLDRAFCRNFADSGMPMEEKTVPPQGQTMQIAADFSNTLGKVSGSTSELVLHSNGTADYTLKAAINNDDLYNKIKDYSCMTDGMYSFDVSIWNIVGSPFSNKQSLSGSDCLSALRSQWDPSAQCESWKSDKWSDGYCDSVNGEVAVCGNAMNGLYHCNWPRQEPVSPRYTCAPGDLGNKFGQYNIKTGLNANFVDTASLIPYLDELMAYSNTANTAVGIHCPIKDGQAPEFLVCAQWYKQ